MKRILAILLALVGVFIGLLAFADSSLCLVALAPLIVGALLFASANRADKERRHREMIEALKSKSG